MKEETTILDDADKEEDVDKKEHVDMVRLDQVDSIERTLIVKEEANYYLKTVEGQVEESKAII